MQDDLKIESPKSGHPVQLSENKCLLAMMSVALKRGYL